MTDVVVLRNKRPLRALAAAFAAIALFAGLTPAVRAAGALVSVIVTARDARDASDAARAAGGEVTAVLPIVDGVAAKIPADRIELLRARADVVADRPMRVQSASYGDALVTAYPRTVAATDLWRRGVTGDGVTVALIDTGVADVPDLADRVVAEANFTREASFSDTYGHGTFQAGLIAGDGTSSDGRYVGIAPGASLMSVKVAGATGETSLSQVLSGVQLVDWSAERFNVRVALLALSSDSPLPPEIDPLSTALRQLWAHGVVVVVPAGNDGPDAESVSSPGEDPVLLTAASVDDRATPSGEDDTVSAFSGRGPTRWGDEKPDVAAPGEHLVSLRAPGSTVDREHASARVESAYFKGSGTSMSAAVTAGAAALVADARPDLSPDAIKAVLMAGASPVDGAEGTDVGAGVVDVREAVDTDTDDLELPAAPSVDDAEPPFAPRGMRFDWVTDGDGRARWLAARWVGRSWNGRTWTDEEWDARSWSARSWAARSWARENWEARSWAGRSWAARSWAGRSWAARTWAGRSWNGRSWAGRSWAGRSWSGRSWNGRSWSGRSWAGRSWSGRTWSDEEWESRSWSARTWSGRSWSGRSWSSRSWS